MKSVQQEVAGGVSRRDHNAIIKSGAIARLDDDFKSEWANVLRCAESVGRISRVYGNDASAFGVGTGALVAVDTVLTAAHLFRADDGSRNAAYAAATVASLRVTFFRYGPDGAPISMTFGAVAGSLRGHDQPGDWATFKLRTESIAGPRPAPLPVSRRALAVGDRVAIIHFPAGGPQQTCTAWGRVHAAASSPGEYVHYDLDTRSGSSGAPVFDEHWGIAAVHDDCTGVRGVNRGTSLAFVPID